MYCIGKQRPYGIISKHLDKNISIKLEDSALIGQNPDSTIDSVDMNSIYFGFID